LLCPAKDLWARKKSCASGPKQCTHTSSTALAFERSNACRVHRRYCCQHQRSTHITSVATRKGKKAFPVATRKGKKAFPRLLFFLSQSPGSYFAMVDSGTSMHILQYRLFTSNLFEDHTAVSGFSDNTSQATHRGEFNCVVRAQNGRLFHLVDP